MRLVILDSYYPDAIAAIPFDSSASYDANLRTVLNFQFGTFDAYSRNLRPLGHEVIDIIGNHPDLQYQWAQEHGWRGGSCQSIALEQIKTFKPDVLFMQDLSFFDASTLRMLSNWYLLAGQCSCPMPAYENVRQFKVLFTSFPHFVPKFEEAGVRAVYLPLAFEPSVLQGPQPIRDIDISFVGGVGASSHWKSGTDTLEIVAAAFPTRFSWWGYGLDRLPTDSALRACYRGEAYGRDLYSIYRRSKMVANRHGEVAEGFTNNLRCFESVGCGALLMTEDSPNLDTLFHGSVVGYRNESDLCAQIRFYLERDKDREILASAGQRFVMRNHTYKERMKIVSDVLSRCLESKAQITGVV